MILTESDFGVDMFDSNLYIPILPLTTLTLLLSLCQMSCFGRTCAVKKLKYQCPAN